MDDNHPSEGSEADSAISDRGAIQRTIHTRRYLCRSEGRVKHAHTTVQRDCRIEESRTAVVENILF